ncbi:aldose epimerase family protein [Flavobacterium sp. DG1-102-2]|uniref:aldose epimerase family protein n=1 Tax=Flavobacterium sp. DG1-102-2 TaxID=3081663 RepID=UPI0029498D09|nr:aldose epimerase family protein [Flavobacterium sp. DG1-102-2]MDV6169465.1 aldose epimerase family protein [Flavobacterium sp. DG1-102-2]
MEKNHISHFTTDSIAKLFGALPDGTAVHSYTLTNSKGLEVTFITYGAAISSLLVTGKDGVKTDVVLGFDSVEGYLASYTVPSPPYFGAVIGRYAGRIANAAFTIDGQQYNLDKNHNENTLHGGHLGFCRVVWQVKEVKQEADNASITFEYTSPDGDQHFPGELVTQVTYTLTPDNEIKIDYKAQSSRDTVINLTQHSYFNLDGHKGNVLTQQLMVNTPAILEITEDGIPTGKYIKAADKGFDFTSPAGCPASIDNSFALTDASAPAVTLESESTGLKMTVYTDQPSVHIYVGGNCFGQVKGKEDAEYHANSGICFETQNYPDAPNHTNFPNAILRKGETYTQKTIWKFEQL